MIEKKQKNTHTRQKTRIFKKYHKNKTRKKKITKKTKPNTW